MGASKYVDSIQLIKKNKKNFISQDIISTTISKRSAISKQFEENEQNYEKNIK